MLSVLNHCKIHLLTSCRKYYLFYTARQPKNVIITDLNKSKASTA